jgi:agmatine deiminase
MAEATGADRGVDAGVRLPAEWEPHERTIMCWPARDELWGEFRPRALDAYAAVARAVGEFEPVTVIAQPGRGAEAAAACGSGVEVQELPIDDSWARDTGPLHLVDERGALAVAGVEFNGWGGKFTPYEDDAALARRWAALHALAVVDEPLVLEGGAVAVDGAGTVVTTEQCLLHPNRNPHLTRTAIEAGLRRVLGVRTVVWVPHGLALDEHTDGHVDNVAAFCRPGVVLVQGCDDPAEADHDRLSVNRRCLADTPDARGEPLRVIEVPVLPFTELAGRRVAVPYLNFYVCNGGVVVPVTGHPADDEMLGVIADAFPGRRVVPVPGEVLAFGGGGPHCITQQVPRGGAGAEPGGRR